MGTGVVEVVSERPTSFKIILARKALLEVLKSLAPAVGVSKNVNLLRCVRIEAHEGPMGLGSLKLTTWNGELTSERTLSAHVSRSGCACVPYGPLARFVEVMPEDDMQLEIDGDNLKVSTKTIERTFFGALGGDEFPVYQAAPVPGGYEMPFEAFQKIVRLCGFATSKYQHRQILTGVFFDQNGASAVATDTHRLACLRGVAGKGQYVVTNQAVAAMLAARPGKDATVRINAFDIEGKGQRLAIEIAWEGGAAWINQVFLSGNFPNYERVIPAEHTNRIVIDRVMLLQSIRRAMSVARDNANRVRLDFGTESVKVWGRSEESGDYAEHIYGTTTDGIPADKPFECAFNGAYLTQFLTCVSGEKVVLCGTESFRPAVWTCPDEPDYIHCIMPMAIT